MISPFAPGALLAQTYPLPRGPRVRLRLPQVRDAPAIRSLLQRQGLEPEELAIARLVRFDPRRQVVICAAALIDSRETILGVGEIGLGPELAVAPKQLYVDEQLTDGLDGLLIRALVGHASAIVRARAVRPAGRYSPRRGGRHRFGAAAVLQSRNRRADRGSRDHRAR